MDLKPLADFWALVLDVWQRGVYGVDIGQFLTAIGIFLALLAVRRLFTRFVIRQIKRLASRTATEVDDRIIDALEGPIRFIPIVVGFFLASQQFDRSGASQTFFLNLNRSLIAFTIFWALFQMVNPVFYVLSGIRAAFTESMIEWMAKAGKTIFVVLGAAAILETWGIRVAPLIAGLGLFGVAVALGAQDIFKNLLAGLFVIGERRYNVGDWVKVADVVEGTVESIGFRTTKIRRFDKAPVYVPNSKLSDDAVVNFSQMTHRRIYWKIGLEYRTTIEQLRRIRDAIEAYVLNSEDFAKPPEVPTFVRVDSFNDSSIDLMLYCFTRTTVWGEWLEIKEALAYKIKDVVEGNGTSFAFPSQSLYVETLPEKPEVFPLQAEESRSPER